MRFVSACAAAMAISVAMTVPTIASGGLSCTAEGGKATFEIESGVTRGMGGPVFNFRGAIEVQDESIEPDLRKIEVGEEHLPQYWLDGEELRLLVYRERAEGDHGYVELTIRTKSDGDEGTYSGGYELTVLDTKNDTSAEGKRFETSGKVTCFVE